MKTESAVEFPTPTRVHVALAVRDAARATAFYRALFGQEPTKVRPGYAKFEVLDPPLNLALNETPQAVAPPLPQHFGIQVQRHAGIDVVADRLRAAGYGGEVEGQVTCCYAVQDKIWFTDPDGHRWELFIVTEADSPVHSRGQVGPRELAAPPCCGPQASASEPAPTETAQEASDEPCCAPTCCS
ncbi:MAG: VOC family protein [Myxococcales bacterium]|nr:VOC family protein [Myxococcales bacterium]MCB9715855.1 VOC family protein [Myxococcales bacterium]